MSREPVTHSLGGRALLFSLACLLLVDCLRPCRGRGGLGVPGGNLDSLTVKEDCE